MSAVAGKSLASSTQSKLESVPEKLRRPIARSPAVNVLWNWAGVLTEALSGILITPILIRSLGDETYGLWILIGSVTGCFGMLDFGLRGAVGRYVALYHAQGDQCAVQRVLSTAAVALACVGLTSLLATAVAASVLPWLYTLPADQVTAVRWATLVVGLQLALFFILRMFDATLWAYQRFDLLNLIDIPTTLIRSTLVAWLIGMSGGGLVTLALISLGTVVTSGLAKCWMTYRTTPGLVLRPAYAARTMFRELIGYGFWNFVISVTAMARTQLSPLLVGGMVGLSAVGPFSVVMRLPAMATMILTAATGVFTPVAVAMHAQGDHAQRERLLVEGTRLSLSFALFFLALFIWLGKPLLTIWIRPDFASHWALLVIIGCGEVLPMAMSVAAGMIQAMAKHRRLAWLVAGETAAALGAAAVFGSSAGLIGFVTALAIVATIFRGVFVLIYACRLANIPPLGFAAQTLVIPLLCTIVACMPLHLAVAVRPPTNWLFLSAYTIAFSVLFCAVVIGGVVGWHRVNEVWHRLRPTSTAS